MQVSTTAVNAAPDHDTLAEDVTVAKGEHDSDRDSLLSHDPEDEDAEPDWLESD